MTSLSESSAKKADPYRVMVVDDSAVIRGLLTRSLDADPEITVVASAANGKIALSALKRHDVEIVVLDIEMPVMDGLTALPLLLEAQPGLPVLMASTLTQKNADVSLEALRLGAADYVPKPSTGSQLTSADNFHRELRGKVKALCQTRRRRAGRGLVSSPSRGSARVGRPLPNPGKVEGKGSPGDIKLRPPPRFSPEAIAIGSSTGGPQALFHVLSGLGPKVRQPIFITQHMPATFTTLLAQHITRASQVPCVEGQDGYHVTPGQAYVAPGEYHMTIEGTARAPVIRLNQDPPENFCRPSVDPMLRSLVGIYGKRLLMIMLTGMGSDGLPGSRAVVAAGGAVIAQDEATSVVWGMPGAVAQAGVCSAVLPVTEIAPYVQRLMARSAA